MMMTMMTIGRMIIVMGMVMIGEMMMGGVMAAILAILGKMAAAMKMMEIDISISPSENI